MDTSLLRSGTLISFIMPAKNAEKFIHSSIEPFLKDNKFLGEWELIIVEDHSTDKTFDICDVYQKNSKHITVFKNPGIGKVDGLNYGYTKSEGNIIKCIDADDVLDLNIIENLKRLDSMQACCHDALIVDEKLDYMGEYAVNKGLIAYSFENCVYRLASLPRWSWGFHRTLADKIFPMPENLPFEDVWFSLVIKKFANTIKSLDVPFYKYRQHSEQTFGGILNFRPDIVLFRAKRIIKLIDVLKNNAQVFCMDILDMEKLLNEQKEFNDILCKEKVSFLNIITSKISITLKIKGILYKKLYFIAPFTLKIKWYYDKIKK